MLMYSGEAYGDVEKGTNTHTVTWSAHQQWAKHWSGHMAELRSIHIKC